MMHELNPVTAISDEFAAELESTGPSGTRELIERLMASHRTHERALHNVIEVSRRSLSQVMAVAGPGSGLSFAAAMRVAAVGAAIEVSADLPVRVLSTEDPQPDDITERIAKVVGVALTDDVLGKVVEFESRLAAGESPESVMADAEKEHDRIHGGDEGAAARFHTAEEGGEQPESTLPGKTPEAEAEDELLRKLDW